MGTIATDMFTLSRLHSTNATKSAKIMDQRFFWPPSVMSKRTSSATVSASTGPPPPARGTTDAARRAAGAAIAAGAARETAPTRAIAPVATNLPAPIFATGVAAQRTVRAVRRAETRAPLKTAVVGTTDIMDAMVGSATWGERCVEVACSARSRGFFLFRRAGFRRESRVRDSSIQHGRHAAFQMPKRRNDVSWIGHVTRQSATWFIRRFSAMNFSVGFGGVNFPVRSRFTKKKKMFKNVARALRFVAHGARVPRFNNPRECDVRDV